MNRVLKLMSDHRSIRKYEPRDIQVLDLEEIIQSSQWASTSNNLQAYSIIIIKDNKKKETLSTLCGNQQQIIDCPVFLVFCADLNRTRTVSENEGCSAHLDTIEPLLVTTIDTALIAQNVMLAAESKGLGGVYIGGIRNNSQEVSDMIELPELVYPVFGMCLGYPKKEEIPDQKPRLPFEAFVHKEVYDQNKLKEYIPKYDSIIKNYYENRTSYKRNENWSEYVAKMYQEPRRTHLSKFLLQKNFGFK